MKRSLTAVASAGAVLLAVAVGGSALSPSPAQCLDPDGCRPRRAQLDDDAYLRALSLDLRGVIASPEEHERMGADGIEPLLTEWLDSPAFGRRVARRHRSLLWPSIADVTLLYHFRRHLDAVPVDGPGSASIYMQFAPQTRAAYRGDGARGCRDEPATFGPDGSIEVDAEGREGYVTVRPYWDLDREIRVCAFDAQIAQTSPEGNDCVSREGIGDPGCGCGPNLRWCGSFAVRDVVLRAFSDELERRIEAHIAADESYTALFTSRRSFVNGPLAHFWRHHRESYHRVTLVPSALDVVDVPRTEMEGGSLRFTDTEEWVEVQLPAPHAGLLTHPVFLLRFSTNRARANRFYDAFLCEPFVAPEGGIPLGDEDTQADLDVQRRPGCAYCHAALEPAAAHWGRWTQQGGGYLDPTSHPAYRQDCRDCAVGLHPCSQTCDTHYITRALSPQVEPYLGWLRAYEFLRDEHRPNVDEGPAALVQRAVRDGRLASCTVRRTAEWLLGRPLRDEEGPWARELTAQFAAADFRYRELVRAVVTSDTYRRAR